MIILKRDAVTIRAHNSYCLRNFPAALPTEISPANSSGAGDSAASWRVHKSPTHIYFTMVQTQYANYYSCQDKVASPPASNKPTNNALGPLLM